LEHLDIINRIIEAEQEAQKIADEAAGRKKHLNETISGDRDKIRDDYMSHAKRRIDIVRESERTACDEAIAQIEEHLKQKLEMVETTYQKNRERWISELFQSVIGK